MFVTIIIKLALCVLVLHTVHCSGRIHNHHNHFHNAHSDQPTKERTPRVLLYNGTDGAIEYLQKFGYLDDISIGTDSMSLTDIRDSIKDFQEVMRLNVTGILDEATIKLMNTERCANKDKVNHHHHSQQFLAKYLLHERNKRYALAGSKWEKFQVTYKITQYSRQRKVSPGLIDREIDQAFRVWEREININFVRSSLPTVDIEVRFATGHHGDGFAFEYNSNVFAHAFYPTGSGIAGDVHFNDHIDWTVKNKLLYVAVHEIGHSLGLRHSSVPNSIMYSYLVRDLSHDLRLDTDDISGIQNIYGSRVYNTNTVPITTPTTTTIRSTTTTQNAIFPNVTNDKDLCSGDSRIDSITTLPNQDVLVFKGENMYRFRVDTESNTLKPVSGPISIRKHFNNRIPSNLDAVFTRNKKTYFLKGNLFWRTSGLIVDGLYPKEIKNFFVGLPDNVDDAFVWSDGNLYFFKGSQFYFFNERSKSRVGKVLDIKRHWRGVPENIDSVFQGPNGKTYFFKSENYWRYDDQRDAVSVSSPSYPRSAADWFFGCNSRFEPRFSSV